MLMGIAFSGDVEVETSGRGNGLRGCPGDSSLLRHGSAVAPIDGGGQSAAALSVAGGTMRA